MIPRSSSARLIVSITTFSLSTPTSGCNRFGLTSTGPAAGRVDDQRIVQHVGCGDRFTAPAAGVRQQAIRELVCSLVGCRVRHGRTPQQCYSQDVVLYVVTIFAVVQQTDTIVAFTQVNPLVRTHLELRSIPSCIAVCGPLDIAPLDFVARLVGVNRHGKGGLEQNVLLPPFDPCCDVESPAMVVEGDLLGVVAVEDLSLDFDGCAEGSRLDKRTDLAGCAVHMVSS